MEPIALNSAIATGLHTFASIIWVGGMFFAHMALRPAMPVLSPQQRLALWNEVLPRFFAWVWAAVIIINLTGFTVVFTDFGGFATAGPHVHVMATLGLIMTAVFLFIFFVPYRRFRARVLEEAWTEAAAAQALIRRLVALNLILGLISAISGASGRFWG